MRHSRHDARALLRQIAFVILVSTSSLAQSQSAPTRATSARRQVLVSVPDRKLAVIENGKVLRTFSVSVVVGEMNLNVWLRTLTSAMVCSILGMWQLMHSLPALPA